MDLQVPYSIYTKVQTKSNIQGNKEVYTTNNKRFVQVEGYINNRRTYDAGSCAPISKRAAQV